MFPAPAALPRAPALTTSSSSKRAESWAQAFNLWLNSRVSPHTRRAYSYAWTAFQTYTGKLPWEMTRADIALWLDAQRADGLSPNTLNQRLAAISSFFTYVSHIYLTNSPGSSDSPLCQFNPVHSVPRPKRQTYQSARYLTVPEARALLRAIPRYTVRGLRDYALFLTYLVTGRRNSEIRQLTYGDFEVEHLTSNSLNRQSLTAKRQVLTTNPPSPISNPHIYYRWSGKGKSRRDQCPLPVWNSIQAYLRAAGKLTTIQPDDYIFTPLTDCAARLPNVDPARWTRNHPISSREVGRLLKKYARRAGLDPSRVHVHTLRHTAAMLRKQAGDDIDQISAFLGHSSLSTTQVYLHRLEGQTDTSWSRVAALLGLDSSPESGRHPERSVATSKDAAPLGL